MGARLVRQKAGHSGAEGMSYREKEFSQGPWHVGTNPGCLKDQPAFPNVHDSSGLPHGEDIVAEILGNSETCKANASLIAAAPNLVVALESTEIMLEQVLDALPDQERERVLDQIQDNSVALAKAYGESEADQ